MSDWHPHIERWPGPRYLAIADALARDISHGVLRPGDRLPTHRALARRLGINVGTVTRAYGEAERRGLADGEVGRGTFVRDARARPPVPLPAADQALPLNQRPAGEAIDLATNRPVLGPQGREMMATLRALGAATDLLATLDYQPEAGAFGDRAAGADWLAGLGIAAPAERLLVTGGGQHALVVALAALADRGDTVLCGALSYPGLKAAAKMLGLRLTGVLMDGDGLLPESFELACWSSGAKILYVMPTLHNPTTATMPEGRRRAMLAIAARYGVTIIEDDVCGLLHPAPPPRFTDLAPDRCYYLSGFSKAVAPGLRVGYLLAPAGESDRERFAAALRATVWMAPPLMARIATTWIGDGTAARLVEWQRHRAEERRAVLTSRLGGFDVATEPGALHAWLRLPESWRAPDFARAAAARGVLVTPGDHFATGRAAAPNAVRLGLGAAPTVIDLRAGVDVIADLLGASPEPRLPIV